ncbi:MAG TPA: putative dsRNA-binding protein, partial [Terriglobales bacterium]|nr:putative dsRNA-binding protein [Terriglobales bacterium]
LLTEHYPEIDEGQLSKFRAALVNTLSLAGKARELGLDRWLRLGRGEEKSRGREKVSILAATYEAVIGALFRDAGYATARGVVAQQFRDAVAGVAELQTPDPKTELQEVCQAICRTTPVYRVVEQQGPDHARKYVVEVLLGTVPLAVGEGSSKRMAEQVAALEALRSSRELISSLAEGAGD